MIWAETGTRQGATSEQVAGVARLWNRFRVTVLHDGDCVGVDEQLYFMARAFNAKLVIHPPSNPVYRAYCGKFDTSVDEVPPKPYLERDRSIVLSSTLLVALPRLGTEEQKGGTWYTIRFARSQGTPTAIVWPDGLIALENWSEVS